MADHEVRLSTQNFLVAGIDLAFEVKVDGATLGTLSVSEGGLDWRPRHGRRKSPIAVSWTEFDRFARTKGEPSS